MAAGRQGGCGGRGVSPRPALHENAERRQYHAVKCLTASVEVSN